MSKFKFDNRVSEQMFGREAGKLMFQESESESSFITENILTTVMEPFDSDNFSAEQKFKAKSNARNIENQIWRLVRIFEKKGMQDKLE